MLTCIKNECRTLYHDPWGMALISYIPFFSILGLWWLFSAAIPRQLPVAVVDKDQSSFSRSLIRHMEANPTTTTHLFVHASDAIAAMRNASVFALVTIPEKCFQQMVRGHNPTLDIRYNGQFLLIGKMLSSSLTLSIASALSTVAKKKQRLDGVPEPLLNQHIMPVRSQITALFNRNNNYVAFLVPPILIALFQLFAMLIFANSLNRELDSDHYTDWLCNNLYHHLLVKIIVYTPLTMIQGTFFICLIFLYIGIPIAGSLFLLIIAQSLMLLALWLIIIGLFFLLQDSTSVISFSTALLAPAFAYMGITFPVDNMPLLARLWRMLMPSSHYIEIYLDIVSYGNGLKAVLSSSVGYWGYLLLMPVIYGLIKIRQSQAAASVAGESHS